MSGICLMYGKPTNSAQIDKVKDRCWSLGIVAGAQPTTSEVLSHDFQVVDRGMIFENQTYVNEFILLGFSNPQRLQKFLLALFLLAYILTISGNVTIVTIVQLHQQLQTPMYLFLSHLSLIEIGHMTNTIPKMLFDFLKDRKVISKVGCFTQLYFNLFLGLTENFLLVLMAYDRFLAICNPMNYTTVMNNRVCKSLILGCWVGGLLAPLPPAIVLARLNFCGPNIINHFFCDLAPVLTLPCGKKSFIEFFFFVFSSSMVLGCFFLIIVSYVNIIVAVLKMPPSGGRHKAFSTCTAHLSVVLIYYGSVIYMYVRPSVKDIRDSDKVVSVFYCVVTPFLNPFIYSLRNTKVHEAFKSLILRRRI
ncbi:olfactory receptor 6N1-like [Zootoca vivipara]|uniref:olfactory receptor 6N1-like n=1 Tax=Zootoca vivipara TaxID=8524 RepID=UPI00293B92CA|nr:olfactory receptor 6N1-like [Zootoca vivipara]